MISSITSNFGVNAETADLVGIKNGLCETFEVEGTFEIQPDPFKIERGFTVIAVWVIGVGWTLT